MLDDDHRERRRTPCHILAAAVLVGILVSPSTVSAGTLAGRLTDALTGTPVADADVRVLGTNRTTRTDDRGRWQFDLPPGTYRLHFVARLGGERHETRLVNQRVPQYKSAEAHLYTDYFLERGDPRLADPPGAPPSERPPPSTPHSNEPIRLPLPPADGRPGPGSLDLPGTPPASIRVARRKHPDRGCRGNPIVAIEKMSLEEYVRGVLPPEIGVFRNLSNIGQTYRAFAIAARSYGLWFRLRYGRGNRRRLGRSVPPHGYSWYHIGDTACEQRYSDNRLAITDRAVDAVSGRIMVRASDRDLLEKFEYAASCGAHGTRPAFQRSLVPDRPPDSACVNNWCGHDDCAGHEDNPQVPGSDSCLVRGMCQWSAASWSEAGKGWTWIVDHYQPNLDVRRIGDDRNRAVLTGYAYTDPSNILETALPGVEVTVDGRWSTRTDESGRYRLKRLPTETVEGGASDPVLDDLRDCFDATDDVPAEPAV
ncbi:MAG: carboxypeptidase regulatory-like domain-containing protein, partial [Bradymonadaceae bacterium]